MLPLSDINLGTGFKKYFRIASALNEEQKNDVYRVRHAVYCEDLGFEPVRSDHREIDRYDAQSVHCLLSTAEPPHLAVGCARLVLCDPNEPAAPLPFENTCAGALDRSIVDTARLPRQRIGEVSRLAVTAAFRRRKGEDRRQGAVPLREEDFGSTEYPRFPYIPISLYMGAIALARRHGVDTIFILTEPRLATHFARLGVNVQPIGSAIEHRGARIPSMIDVHDVIDNMRTLMKPLWRVVLEQIERGYEGRDVR